MPEASIIGGGLAGCEAAWFLANRGWTVNLYEMRPEAMTPAHKGGDLAELVCSNSLGAMNPDSAGGLLKRELRILNSLIIDCADMTRVPAGGALAVDRGEFARLVTGRISGHPNVRVHREQFGSFPDPPAIIATGPLTSENLSKVLREKLGQDLLFFYDAASPIIQADSIDYSKVFPGSRYGKGGDDYLNCPMTFEEYQIFYSQLIEAETAVLKDFEGNMYFEHCLPVEVIGKRGPKTLCFGPLKPIGLIDPRTGIQPYAVVQLRREDIHGQLYNLVGFQTNLTWTEQRRVFRLIPGLEKASFARFGVMHRNTFIDAPKVLGRNFRLRDYPGLYIAGQLSGVEGYLESAASGLVAALDLWGQGAGREIVLPVETLLGSLSVYVTRSSPDFQPMNANFGLLPPLDGRFSKKERRKLLAQRAEENILLFAKDLII